MEVCADNRDNGVPITSCNLNQVVEFAWIVPACSYHADPNVRSTIIYNKDTILNFCALILCNIPAWKDLPLKCLVDGYFRRIIPVKGQNRTD